MCAIEHYSLRGNPSEVRIALRRAFSLFYLRHLVVDALLSRRPAGHCSAAKLNTKILAQFSGVAQDSRSMYR